MTPEMTSKMASETTSDLKSIYSTKTVAELTPTELAQVLAERLAISPNDWHRRK